VEVTVAVVTVGSDYWRDLGDGIALPSALQAGADRVLRIHRPGLTLAAARNAAVQQAETEWIVFLDADDELEPGYLEALDAPDVLSDLRAPAVRWLPAPWETPYPEVLPPPVVLDDRDIRTLNPCVIGTAIRRELVAELGGFLEWPAWEDWCLFRRAVLAGATLEHVPRAVYRAHVREHHRNELDPVAARRLHRRIRSYHAEWLRSRKAPR
jgi:glycosyltransferase involved in cell wall biosynthesis